MSNEAANLHTRGRLPWWTPVWRFCLAVMLLAIGNLGSQAQAQEAPADEQAPAAAETTAAEPSEPAAEQPAEQPAATEAEEASVLASEPQPAAPEPVPEAPAEPKPIPVESPASAPETMPAAPAPIPKAAVKETEKLGGPPRHGQGGIVFAGFNINGRFDVAYELGDFALDVAHDLENAVKNYHHFLFISRNQEDEWFSFNVEAIDLSFYEIGLKVTNWAQVRLGKVLMPFGADPLFHHSYGGLSGFDQTLLPFIWAEHGVVIDVNLHQSDMLSVDNELYVVTGISGSDDQVLRLNAASDPGTLAVGDRVRVGYGDFAAAVSVYTDRYAEGKYFFLWGLDFSAGYGFLPWPYLDQLSVKLGLARADVESATFGNYYHFGDYLQFDYRLPALMGLRYRTGVITSENHQGVFFDDREPRKGPDDTLAHSITFWKRYRGLSVAAEFIINIEAAGEVDNDLFRLTAAVDF